MVQAFVGGRRGREGWECCRRRKSEKVQAFVGGRRGREGWGCCRRRKSRKWFRLLLGAGEAERGGDVVGCI